MLLYAVFKEKQFQLLNYLGLYVSIWVQINGIIVFDCFYFHCFNRFAHNFLLSHVCFLCKYLTIWGCPSAGFSLDYIIPAITLIKEICVKTIYVIINGVGGAITILSVSDSHGNQQGITKFITSSSEYEISITHHLNAYPSGYRNYSPYISIFLWTSHVISRGLIQQVWPTRDFYINIINIHLTKGHPENIPRKHMPELLSKATRWPAANWQEANREGLV